MAQQKPPSADSDDTPRGDPWHAFGYLVSGVLMYGLIGWVLDRWLGTSWLVVVGIVTGAGLGIYMTWVRFNKARPAPPGEQTDETI
ncbi:conserved hypothetical protein [metagenome]|uniref:ATP synthase protein I n=1 Tax=metagenome TaxID=256318 RepID=A0A2P2C1V6_9ZZZZ